MAFFKLAGTAHSRAAASVIATIGRKSQATKAARGKAPRPAARGAPKPFAEIDADAPDESQFARF